MPLNSSRVAKATQVSPRDIISRFYYNNEAGERKVMTFYSSGVMIAITTNSLSSKKVESRHSGMCKLKDDLNGKSLWSTLMSY